MSTTTNKKEIRIITPSRPDVETHYLDDYEVNIPKEPLRCEKYTYLIDELNEKEEGIIDKLLWLVKQEEVIINVTIAVIKILAKVLVK